MGTNLKGCVGRRPVDMSYPKNPTKPTGPMTPDAYRNMKDAHRREVALRAEQKKLKKGKNKKGKNNAF